MMRWLATLIASLLIATTAFAIDTTRFDDPDKQAQYQRMTHELRCMQCQNQSIADSPVGLASDLRDEVREMLVAGQSDDDIRNFMVTRYGEFILFRPRFSVRNAWLWLLPAVLLALGAIVAVRIVRQRSTLLDADDSAVDEDAPGPGKT